MSRCYPRFWVLIPHSIDRHDDTLSQRGCNLNEVILSHEVKLTQKMLHPLQEVHYQTSSNHAHSEIASSNSINAKKREIDSATCTQSYEGNKNFGERVGILTLSKK